MEPNVCWLDAIALFESAARADREAIGVIVEHCESPRTLLALLARLLEFGLTGFAAADVGRFAAAARAVGPPPELAAQHRADG